MSDTPRTDAAYFAPASTIDDIAQAMRQLERELNTITENALALSQANAELRSRIRRLEDALGNVINAGKPNQAEHPTMWKAWLKARLVMQDKEAKP